MRVCSHRGPTAKLSVLVGPSEPVAPLNEFFARDASSPSRSPHFVSSLSAASLVTGSQDALPVVFHRTKQLFV